MRAIYYFRRPNTTFDGYILHSTAIYYFRRLYTVLALHCCDYARIQVFPEISFICGLNTWLEFSSNLLALILFCFFCSSVVSHVKFNFPFRKRYFIRSTQMLKMWNFLALIKADLDIFNWIKPCYSNCNVHQTTI